MALLCFAVLFCGFFVVRRGEIVVTNLSFFFEVMFAHYGVLWCCATVKDMGHKSVIEGALFGLSTPDLAE